MRIGVVGCGLIGAAAARHLAKGGHEVLLIGPNEPGDKRRHTGVFGSHYDEGRITRRLATERFWAEVSSASIDRYGEISKESGIRFHTPCGAMIAGARDMDFMGKAEAVRTAMDLDAEELDASRLAAHAPYFCFPQTFHAFHEHSGGGHISPRRLVRAQARAANRHGARHIARPVTALTEHPDSVVLHTEAEDHTVDRALIAAGAMTDHIAPTTVPQKVFGRTVALFEVDHRQARRLTAMPSLVFRWSDVPGEPYLLPPIRYPDGKIYLKLGGDPDDLHLTSAKDICDWFRAGGRTGVRDHLANSIRRLMPGLEIRSTKMDACVTSFTPSGRPVIDWLSSRVATATGGNGAGAKCSDELGRLGAALTTGVADPQLEHTKHI
ncbi:MAG: FAD-dependent oxidoreductase [Pseudomonadota bacterium]